LNRISAAYYPFRIPFAMIRLFFPLALTVLIAASFVAGCRETSVENKQAQSTPLQESPEESLTRIMEIFRRGVEAVEIGFIVRDGDGHSMMSGSNKVTHQLIPPGEDDPRYRAIITVSSQSRYSIQRSTDGEDPQSQAKPSKSRPNPLAESGEQQGVEVLDPELLSAQRQDADDRGTSESERQVTVARRQSAAERKYELVYENDRWILVTPLDPETERSIQNAFDRALAEQI